MSRSDPESTDFSIKNEIHKIRNLPKGKRWEYFWMYYKIPVLLLPVILVAVWMLGSFAVSAFRGTFFPKDPISVAIAVPGFTGCDDWMEACREAIGYDSQTENLQVIACAPYTPGSNDFVISSTLWLTAGQPDIFIVDEASYDYLLTLDVLSELSAWPESLQRLAGERKVDAFALDITDTVFARRYCPEGTVYLCMYSSGHGWERALDIVEYLLLESAA